MRSTFTFSALILCLSLSAQIVDELGVSLGPKIEFNSSTAEAIRVHPGLDASLNVQLARRIDPHWRIHLMYVQRNYSARYDVRFLDPWVEQEHTYFPSSVQPQFTSHQLALFPSYSTSFGRNWDWWIGAGIQGYISRTLDEKNPGPLVDYLRDAEGEEVSNATLYLYRSELGPGNYFIRLEGGVQRQFSDRIAVEASLYGMASGLGHHSFYIKVLDANGDTRVDHSIENRGAGIGLNLGIRVQLIKKEEG